MVSLNDHVNVCVCFEGMDMHKLCVCVSFLWLSLCQASSEECAKPRLLRDLISDARGVLRRSRGSDTVYVIAYHITADLITC